MNSPKINHIQLLFKENIVDIPARRLREEADKYLHLQSGRVRSAKIFSITYELNEQQLHDFANNSLGDGILHDLFINTLYRDEAFSNYILVSKLPGVTDDEGISAQKALCDLLNLPFDFSAQWIFTQEIFYIENKLASGDLARMAEELLGNPLINHFEYGQFDGRVKYIPTVQLKSDSQIETIDIFVENEKLQQLSRDLLLALDVREMRAIKDYFTDEQVRGKREKVGLSRLPTDCELEILAQTWSEHCKHKEFNALITYIDKDSGQEKIIDSLFNTYIKRSTEIIQHRLEQYGQHWLLKVFADNAGVVRIDDQRVFIWKVETHNSPSALDPYGGALTGIVGVNRDPLGTGVGGGKLLFNTDVLCFASPYYDGALLPGQLHPRRIMSGVVKGIEDGGNKSGIPTINGAVVFDDRFRGKPLVFCGTGAVMPAHYKGRESWYKRIDREDRIIMAGGRVGKDGIHGATFSSLEIDEHSPRSAVQIGSPITQKNLADFMEQAVLQGWIKCSTDNGAGGLSSSIGELANISGGAIVNLEKVPLKYSGLKPWEIFVSESQERMTLVVEKEHVARLMDFAADYEVELTDIGYFYDHGYLEVRYNDHVIAYLDLEFLHDGVPRKEMVAEWEKPRLHEPQLPESIDYNRIILQLLQSLNICSREAIIRRYDHEVKGKSIVKALMGEKGLAPQDAAVMRLDFDSFAGIAVSNGICPKFGDLDAYEMSAGAFDEAVRAIIAVGGKLPDLANAQGGFWSVNDNFCVPDSLYHPQNNPDGKYKLAQLVRMNEALFDMATFFNIPMTSGKDSMKNDFIKEGVKISVPPTILYSMVAKIDDVRQTLTGEFKKAGDLIYLVGKTYDELGGSEFYRLFNELGAQVPKVRKEDARRLYLKMNQAQQAGLLVSAHDCSDGGLAIALAEAAFGGYLGADILFPEQDLTLAAQLFSESHSRFVVSVDSQKQKAFEEIFQDDAQYLGTVRDDDRFEIRFKGLSVIHLRIDEMLGAWRGGLQF